MQQSAVPELAHAHPRPIHWLATATALAGVMALSSALQPDAARAAQSGPEAKPAPAVVAAPDPADADLPLDCGPVDLVVKQKASGDLDGDGRPETVAVVHCDASMGTPPDTVYVLTRSTDAAAPRVVATLIAEKDRNTVSDLAVRDGAITATVHGYSSADVPNCCPDKIDDAKWQWRKGAFVRSTPAGTQSV
ncbi:hypothetical protein Sipo8835_09605 [Streptomyces ipomoeae]|uniref:Secreted protein n=4 Tax=Streptomyces ipomoeae TaxID=103232 RepID=L1L7V4_9ACTN|nr:hypothetical protein [Streptomyces ipomoeae]EKX68713.1 hypothetical protein STRIP9103_01684 [Streptomyces ipomoeae 91-03]MDX2822467.1 hypothetical protein [Streptomyces ipomoeae]MDX2839915.1 hypothetical protein [Streptomyces ipomoeae]TQE36771.1 hypothetical protein Sipo8835_09605 [Streptomyces ipomoeae]TQE38872.1 hypothetical protein Sipo7851_05570 [Streptomyces ipomoeae]